MNLTRYACLQLSITTGIAGKSKEKIMINSEYHCICSVLFIDVFLCNTRKMLGKIFLVQRMKLSLTIQHPKTRLRQRNPSR